MTSRQIASATVVALAFFLSAGFAAENTVAQDLFLKRKRLLAVQSLVGSGKTNASMTAQIDFFLTSFFSEKVQQNFELGLSFTESDPALALNHFAQAQQQDPENFTIAAAIARLSLSQGKCASAKEALFPFQNVERFYEEFRLLQAQIFLCLSDFEKYRQYRPQDLKKSQHLIFWQNLEADYLFRSSSFQHLKELIQKMQKTDLDFPESYLWEFKLHQALKTKAEASGQKYLNLCKGLSARNKRKYILEPLLCRKMKEVELATQRN